MKRFLLLVSLSLLLSCSYSGEKMKNKDNINMIENGINSNENISKKLKNTSWKLIELNGKNIENEEDVNITLEFSDNQLYGKAAINNYFSGYNIKGNKIEKEVVGITRMAGPEKLMKIEDEYIEIFDRSTDIELRNEDTLIIKNKDERLVFSKNK